MLLLFTLHFPARCGYVKRITPKLDCRPGGGRLAHAFGCMQARPCEGPSGRTDSERAGLPRPLHKKLECWLQLSAKPMAAG